MKHLDDWANEFHVVAMDKGFWDNYDESPNEFICTKLALVHSEVTEVLEAIRKNKGDEEIMAEIADILIRTMDLYAGLNSRFFEKKQSLDLAVRLKMEKNTNRPALHGNNF